MKSGDYLRGGEENSLEYKWLNAFNLVYLLCNGFVAILFLGGGGDYFKLLAKDAFNAEFVLSGIFECPILKFKQAEIVK